MNERSIKLFVCTLSVVVMACGLGMVLSVAAMAKDAAGSVFGDRNKPVEISADSLEVLQANQKAVFRGKVEVHQGAVMLTAATMTVYYKQQDATNKDAASAGAAGAVSRIEADGHVVLTTPEETARGHKGVYDVDGRRVNLQGDVMLTRGKNILKGETLTYNLDTGRSVLGASDNVIDGQQGVKSGGGRIKALFVPEKK